VKVSLRPSPPHLHPSMPPPTPPLLSLPLPVGASEMLKNLLSQLLRCNLRTSCAIVFVAASGNGKSTFIGRLLQDSFCPPGPDCTTVHRDVYHITYPVPNEELVRDVESWFSGLTSGPFDLRLLAEEDSHNVSRDYLPPRCEA
jgi:hypothetical protein